jgi:hypothetical protein
VESPSAAAGSVIEDTVPTKLRYGTGEELAVVHDIIAACMAAGSLKTGRLILASKILCEMNERAVWL